MDWTTIIVSFLTALMGSGVLAAVLTNRHGKTEREARYVRTQLEKVYGPLMFHIESIDQEGSHMVELMNLGQDLYGGISICEAEDPESDPYKLQVVIDECGMDMLGHCMDMVDTIKANYAYIDPDDMEAFAILIKNRRRWLSVIGDEGNLRVSEEIQDMLEIPTWRHREVWRKTAEKFLAKQKRLKELGG